MTEAGTQRLEGEGDTLNSTRMFSRSGSKFLGHLISTERVNGNKESYTLETVYERQEGQYSSSETLTEMHSGVGQNLLQVGRMDRLITGKTSAETESSMRQKQPKVGRRDSLVTAEMLTETKSGMR